MDRLTCQPDLPQRLSADSAVQMFSVRHRMNIVGAPMLVVSLLAACGPRSSDVIVSRSVANDISIPLARQVVPASMEPGCDHCPRGALAPVEMQQGGWQAILDNFKKYTEATGN